MPIIHFYFDDQERRTVHIPEGAFMKTSLLATFFVSALILVSFSSAAFAVDTVTVPVDCQKAAIRKTYTQLRRDSGWTAEEANQVAYLHDPFHQDEDPENVITVSVESTDVRSWDGYAAYKVTIQPSRNGCQVSEAVLYGADGF